MPKDLSASFIFGGRNFELSRLDENSRRRRRRRKFHFPTFHFYLSLSNGRKLVSFVFRILRVWRKTFFPHDSWSRPARQTLMILASYHVARRNSLPPPSNSPKIDNSYANLRPIYRTCTRSTYGFYSSFPFTWSNYTNKFHLYCFLKPDRFLQDDSFWKVYVNKNKKKGHRENTEIPARFRLFLSLP